MRWLVAFVAACSSAPATPGTQTGHKSGVEPGTRCAADSDCAQGQSCFGPDFSPGGGARPECQVDAECSPSVRGPNTPPDLVCTGRSCGPKCTASSCLPTQQCAASGHCEPLPCTDPHAEKCPAFTTCNASSGTCARNACKDDQGCPGGACWRGACFDRGGLCEPSSYCCPP